MNALQYSLFKFKGIVKDIQPVELMNGAQPSPGVPMPNVWTAGRNVHFDNESTHRSGGFKAFAEPLPAGAEPIFGLNVLTPSQSYWIWVDGSVPAVPKIYVTDGTTHFNITPATPLTGGAIGEWSGCVLNGVPVINNQFDPPHWWNGSTASPVTPITGWPAGQLCKAIRAYKYHLIALNITKGAIETPEAYAWSNSADPGSLPTEWVATPSNDAGDNILATSPGGILDGLPLRDDFIIYKAHATFLMSYIGGQFVFSVRKLFNTSGIQGLNCVKELRGHHWVFTDDDIIRHDGNTFTSIADKKIRQFVMNGINPDDQLTAHVALRTPTDEIWFCIPTVDEININTVLVYSFTDDAWGVRTVPDVAYITDGIMPNSGAGPTWGQAIETWATDVRFWGQASYSITNDNLLMFSPVDGAMYDVDAANDANGTPIEAYVERTHWVVQGQDNIWDNILTRSIYPVITGQPGDVIKIRLAGTRVVEQEIEWQPEQDYIIGESLKIDAMTHGRFLNMRFSSAGGAPWEIHRIGVEYIPEAKF